MKMFANLVSIGLILGGLLLTSCSSAGGSLSDNITIATDATAPPFESVDKQTKNIVGFDIDIMNAIAAKQNLNIVYKDVDWDPLLAAMTQGTYDAAISSITITEDRKKQMLFSDPYFAAGQVIITRNDNTSINGKDTLNGQVGVQRDTKGEIEVKKMKAISFVQYDKISKAFEALTNGEIDAVVCDNPVAVLYVGQSSGKLKLVGKPFTDESYGIAVSKNKPDLLKKINAGLKEIKAEGAIEKASAKWFK